VTLPRRGAEGFTLIEMVIAMLVMSIAVVAIVGALASMLRLSRDHRGHAVTETSARSFGQAIQAQAQFKTELSAGVDDATGTIPVNDASLLPPGGSNSYVIVDREVMKVTSVNAAAKTLSVQRGFNGATTAATHASGAGLVPVLHCPTSAQFTPASGTYEKSTAASASITNVEYWQSSSGTFTTDQKACTDDYAVDCPVQSPSTPSIEPECGDGLFRITILVKADNDPRLNGLDTTSQVLVRSGST
jgi:prepilin-type N-terminal cleavage/methylation domain-containing protein